MYCVHYQSYENADSMLRFPKIVTLSPKFSYGLQQDPFKTCAPIFWLMRIASEMLPHSTRSERVAETVPENEKLTFVTWKA